MSRESPRPSRNHLFPLDANRGRLFSPKSAMGWSRSRDIIDFSALQDALLLSKAGFGQERKFATPSTHHEAKAMESEKWVVGDEYDEAAFARLKRALGNLQYSARDQWNAVAGSQDIQHWMAVGPGGQLKIESETYVGLSVEGLSSLIADLKAQYEQTV